MKKVSKLLWVLLALMLAAGVTMMAGCNDDGEIPDGENFDDE